jgi:hypothetical protein
LDFILSHLPLALRKAMEAQMEGYEYQSDFARAYYGQGRAEALRESAQKLVQRWLPRARVSLERCTQLGPPRRCADHGQQ